MLHSFQTMRSLYITQHGCSLSLQRDQVIVKQQGEVCQTIQLPFLEQIMVLGKSQLTTQLICACLARDIPIGYLSSMGRCHGRVLSIAKGYRRLARLQRDLLPQRRLRIAQRLVFAKLRNSRVILQRQQRRQPNADLGNAIAQLDTLGRQVLEARDIPQLMGYEGAGAAAYFGVLGHCLSNPEFEFKGRTKRPPLDPVNALLSFGYQILWNHLLSLIELQGLDPYEACLHQGSDRHAALASDLLEGFRAPIVDSLVLYLINRRMVSAVDDFVFLADGACYLNDSGRRKYLQAFVQRMEESVQVKPGEKSIRWDTLNEQVKIFRDCVVNGDRNYKTYQIR